MLQILRGSATSVHDFPKVKYPQWILFREVRLNPEHRKSNLKHRKSTSETDSYQSQG
jgi:hypothetical protein